MTRALVFGFLVAVLVVGCGSGHRDTKNEQLAIAAAKHVTVHGQFPAALFPSAVGTRSCEVRAGPGNVFRGTCSTSVQLHRDGSSRVTFKQSINGDHFWVFHVAPRGHAALVRDAGAPLVELIP